MPQRAVKQLYKNRLLASLSPLEIQRLSSHLSPVTFKIKHSLHEPGMKIETVYFLEDAIASVVVTMENGHSVEVGLIGRDGIVGISAVMGTGHAINRTFIQVAGTGFALKAKILRDYLELEASNELRTGLYLALQGYMVQTAQTAACNRVHELEERLARWLLMCADRIQSDRVPITHEFLATMLGTRRSSVTIAAGILQKAGLIDYARGKVLIQDREGLVRATCECYQVVHAEYLNLGLL